MALLFDANNWVNPIQSRGIDYCKYKVINGGIMCDGRY